MTPEAKVKAKVKAVLAASGPAVYSHWPVQAGYGAPCLDCNGCVYGFRFDIETKAPGKKPTKRQLMTIAELEAAGSRVFVIDGNTKELEEWISKAIKTV